MWSKASWGNNERPPHIHTHACIITHPPSSHVLAVSAEPERLTCFLRAGATPLAGRCHHDDVVNQEDDEDDKEERKREHPERWLGVLWMRRGPTRAVTCNRMEGSGQTAADEAAGGGDLINTLQLMEETPPLRLIRCQRDGTKPGNRHDCQEKNLRGVQIQHCQRSFLQNTLNIFRLTEPPARAFRD